VSPATAPFSLAECLLRASEVSCALVESWLREARFTVAIEHLNSQTDWSLLVTPSGRAKSLAVIATPDATAIQVQMIFVMDSVQKNALTNSTTVRPEEFLVSLRAALSEAPATMLLAEVSVFENEGHLGSVLFVALKTIPLTDFTRRNLFDAVAAVLSSFDTAERFIVECLGQGIRGRPP